MKKIIEDDESEGLESLLGENITLICMSYFYTGKLVGVNDTCVKLKDPYMVYETGSWEKADWEDAQKLPKEFLYVSIPAIEAFGVMK